MPHTISQQLSPIDGMKTTTYSFNPLISATRLCSIFLQNKVNVCKWWKKKKAKMLLLNTNRGKEFLRKYHYLYKKQAFKIYIDSNIGNCTINSYIQEDIEKLQQCSMIQVSDSIMSMSSRHDFHLTYRF